MTQSYPDAGDTTIYKVVVNRKGQYSIWPEWSEEPGDWRSVAVSGPKSECLAYIEAVWTCVRSAFDVQSNARALRRSLRRSPNSTREPAHDASCGGRPLGPFGEPAGIVSAVCRRDSAWSPLSRR